MRKYRWTIVAIPLGLSALAAAALSTTATAYVGNETVNYTYDPHGRLVKVEHVGSINNNVQANYSYDKADNRVNVNVTGVP